MPLFPAGGTLHSQLNSKSLNFFRDNLFGPFQRRDRAERAVWSPNRRRQCLFAGSRASRRAFCRRRAMPSRPLLPPRSEYSGAGLVAVAAWSASDRATTAIEMNGCIATPSSLPPGAARPAGRRRQAEPLMMAASDVFFHRRRAQRNRTWVELEYDKRQVVAWRRNNEHTTKSPWRNAKKICRLNARQLEMARRLRMNPKKRRTRTRVRTARRSPQAVAWRPGGYGKARQNDRPQALLPPAEDSPLCVHVTLLPSTAGIVHRPTSRLRPCSD